MIDIYVPPEDNADIYRYSQLDLEMHQLEEDEVQNLEKKEQMIIRDGYLSTMMQQQEEEKVQK